MPAIPTFELELTKQGEMFDVTQLDAILTALPRVSDLIVFSHGWNNDMADARRLSQEYLERVQDVLDGGIVPEVQGRTFAAVIVLWPSKKFTEEELIPGGGAASAGAEEDFGPTERLLDALEHDPTRLGGDEVPPVREEILTRARRLLPQLATSAEARREYVYQLRSLVSPDEAHQDDGSLEFFAMDPEEMFEEMSGSVAAPLGPGTGAGGASAVTGAGGAAGLRDVAGGIAGAARRIANFTTYYQMKARAGLVGRTGLGQALRQLRARRSDVRVHLVGHSFGARVVTAAADALDANTPAVTMTLLQGAYSHNGLAEKFDGKNDGFFRKLLSERRISGPILITHTKNDRAVGIAYPLASRLARQKAAAFGDENDPYGGIGRNGAQHTPEAAGLARDLAELTDQQPGPYAFVAGKVYNLKADRFIADHNDICRHQVAYAMLKAAGQV